MVSRAGTIRTTRRRLRAVDSLPADEHPLAAALSRLATALDAAAEQEGWGQPPLLVRITEWPDHGPSEGVDLGVRPVEDGMSVVEALVGFVAPPEWAAIGVVTEGNARHLADPGDRRRVRCVHIVDRAGGCGSTVRLQGEDVTVLASSDEHQPSGRIDDACRRALGLPTAPPAHASTELWAIVWLERLLEQRAAAPSARLPWRDAAALHPAIALVVQEDPTCAGEAAQQLGRLGEVLAQVHSWPVLRMACATGDWPVDGVPADVADWLDDGAFSRWVLGELPGVTQLADAVCEVVPPSVARRVRAVLRTWQLALDTS